MRYSSLWTTWVTLENCGTSGRSNTDVYMHWHYPHSLYMHEEKKQTDRAIRTALTAQLCHLLLALELIFHRGMEGDLHMYNMPEGAGVSTWGCFIQLLSVTLMGYDFKKRYTVIFICQFSAWILHITKRGNEGKICERMHGLVAHRNSPDKKLFALWVWWNNLADGNSPMLSGISVVGSIVWLFISR